MAFGERPKYTSLCKMINLLVILFMLEKGFGLIPSDYHSEQIREKSWCLALDINFNIGSTSARMVTSGQK